MYGSVKVREKNPKNVWCNDVVKEAARNKLLEAKDESAKARCMEVYKEKEMNKVNEVEMERKL